ncbi:serine/threonine-protein kinase [Streptomyces sp. SAS_270]|uniref:serine/threonine-protein kinase n=1 Tax=Streptomyces sp. SAS_270 TaxID=3412748 RepID=UPI00403CFA6D
MADRFKPLTADDPRSVGGYDLRARLGAGGMGRVYLAFTPGGRALAVKVVRPDYAEDDEFRRRFRKEIDAAQRVQGLYTAPVVDADSKAALPWLATAYVPGPSLHQAVTEHGPFPLTTVFRLLAGVAEGLTAIHACELIHRDLKPANILLADDGPRVIDFGIAHAADATTLTSTHVRVGTPAFMAPEQIRGHSASPAVDVFALGNLAVFAATGRTAFGEGNPEAMFFRIINEEPELGGCDPELRAVVERCLAKEPGKRPSVGEVMEYARERIQGETVSLAGSWLPDTVATSLAGYGTAKYTKTIETKKVAKKAEVRREPGVTRKAGDAKSPTGGTTPPSGQDNSLLTGIGCLAALLFIVVVAIGPQKVLDWVKSDGEPSESPGYSAPSYTPTTDYTSGTDTDTGTDDESTEEDTTDPGCEQASQAISSNSDTFDDASSASLSALASNLDSAADAAEDSEVASTIRALANDSRTLSDSAAGAYSARDRGDSTQLDTYQEAFSAGVDQWEKDAETYKSLCE